MSNFSFNPCLSGLDTKELKAQALKYSHLLDDAAANFPWAAGSNGWCDIDGCANEELLCRIEEKARHIRNLADTFVVIGVGGSNNSARALIDALCPHSDIEIIYAGNSTAPSAIGDVLRRIEGKSVFINIIAKNFETLEPGAAFRVLRSELYRRYGDDAAQRIIATGTRGSHLHRLCTEHGWDFYEFPEAVGGRYTAFTAVGLLPVAVAGVDIRSLIEGGKSMRRTLLETPAENNPALLYAAARYLLASKGFSAEILSVCEPRLHSFGKWWIQLFGESEGKQGKGLLPVYCEFSEQLHSIGQFLQDGRPAAFESFLMLEEKDSGVSLKPDGFDDGFDYLDEKNFSQLNSAAFHAALHAHSAHIPCIQFEFGPCREDTFGKLFYFYMLSCVFSCCMNGVNPFDQPGVEAYKHKMFDALGKDGNK